MWRRPACQTLSKALDISSATARVAPDLLKAVAILSDTTMRRSAVDQEDLKPYWRLPGYFICLTKYCIGFYIDTDMIGFTPIFTLLS